MKPSSEKLLFATCLWWKYCHYNIVDILLRCFFVQTSRPVYIRGFKIISSVTHKLAAYTSLLHTQAWWVLFSVLWRMSLLQGSAGPQPLRLSRDQAMAEFSVKGFALFMWWSVWRLLLFNRHTRLLYTDRSAPLLYTQVCCSSLDCSTVHYLSLSSAICMVSWAIYSMLNIRYRRQPDLWPKHNFKTRTKATLCIWKMCRQKPGQSCITLGGNTAIIFYLQYGQLKGFLRV